MKRIIAITKEITPGGPNNITKAPQKLEHPLDITSNSSKAKASKPKASVIKKMNQRK
ncbi:MAG: hypothetical protein WAZ40_00795 [Minisyncoccia bacterium]